MMENNNAHFPHRPPPLPDSLPLFKKTPILAANPSAGSPKASPLAATSPSSRLPPPPVALPPAEPLTMQNPAPQVVFIEDSTQRKQETLLPEVKHEQQRPLPTSEELGKVTTTAVIVHDSNGQTGAVRPKLHHLTRHWLAPESRGNTAVDALGASSAKAAEHMIKGMSQKELRAAFQKVYGSQTSSFNNNWLRRKLFEALGVSGGSARKQKRGSHNNHAATNARRKEQRLAAAAIAEAEAVEALAEIAAGPAIEGADMAESSSDDQNNTS